MVCTCGPFQRKKEKRIRETNRFEIERRGKEKMIKVEKETVEEKETEHELNNRNRQKKKTQTIRLN